MITRKQVEEAQQKWAAGVIAIGELKYDFKKCKAYTEEFIGKMYLYGKSEVLFKPTKAAEEPFRPTKEMALSYFINGEDRVCKEDNGFALKPWKAIRFENHNMILDDNRAIAMGHYFFKDSKENEVMVEYTFGYQLIDGSLRIDLQHSSKPFNP